MGLAKSPRAKHLEHNPKRHSLCFLRGGGGGGGSLKATAPRERGNRQGQAGQVQLGKLTRKTLKAIIKRNSQRPPGLPSRHRETGGDR